MEVTIRQSLQQSNGVKQRKQPGQVSIQGRKRKRQSPFAGWPWVVPTGAGAHPGLPQIRTCAISASGSSGKGFATRWSEPRGGRPEAGDIGRADA